MTPEEVRKTAEHIYYPYADRDWQYTDSNKDFKHIRFKSDSTGYNSLWNRVKRSADHLVHGFTFNCGRADSLRTRLYVIFKIYLRKEDHVPDAWVMGGPIFWSEDASYMVIMRPSVGDQVRKFLDECPDNEYAVAIAKEIQRAIDTAWVIT